MAKGGDADLRVKISAQDDASKVIDKIADQASDLEKHPVEIEVDADVRKVLDALDDVTTEAKRTGEVAEQLADKLGSELGAKADTTRIVGELRAMGLTFEQIEGNVDELTAKLKEMADTDVGGKMGSALGTARGQMEDFGRSADSSKSVLANMVGNSAQDLGELGGIAGSAGVAFGQMGEYMADALHDGDRLGQVLSNFAAVVGPIAALALVTQTLSGYMAIQSRRAEEAAQRTKLVGDAMSETADDALGLSDALAENIDALRKFEATDILGPTNWMNDIAKSIPLIGKLAQNVNVDLVDAMTRAGQSFYGFSDAVTGSADDAQGFADSLYESYQAGLITGKEYEALTQALTQYRKAAKEAAQSQDLMNVGTREAQALLDEVKAGNEPLSRYVTTWQTLIDDIKDGGVNSMAAADAINFLSDALGMTREEVVRIAQAKVDEQFEAQAAAADTARQAAQDYADVLASADWQLSSYDAATRGWERLGAATFNATNIASDVYEAYDNLNAAIKENGFTFDVATEAGRANVDQLQNLYQSLLPGLTAAYTEAGGSVEKFGANMDALRSTVFAELDEQTSLTTDQINALLDQLGVFDSSQYESQFRLLGIEDANSKLALLSGVIQSLPPDVQRQVTLAVIAGDPQAALDTIEATVTGTELPPAVIPTQADNTGAASDVAGFANGEQPTATVPTDANTKPADKSVDGFVDTTEKQKPVVNVNASVREALITMAIIRAIAEAMSPTVTIGADISEAMAGIRTVASQRPRVPADVYVADYPSASEIQRMIGRPRIPVDIVVGQSIRITGVRE